MGPYVLDFFCSTTRLAIELDGGRHAEPDQAEYDQRRTEYLESMRIRVMRFWNHDVFNNLEGVLEAVKLTPPSLDLKRGGRETPSSDEEGAGGV